MKIFKCLLVLMTLSCAVSANSAMFKYNELMIKDYDEMLKLVRTQLNKAKGDDGYIGPRASDRSHETDFFTTQ